MTMIQMLTVMRPYSASVRIQGFLISFIVDAIA